MQDMDDSDTIWQQSAWIARAQLLLNSFAHWTGRQLVPREVTIEDQARTLFHAPFVVVSHGTQPDPVLCYGNATALKLWEMDAATFTQTPSRLTAEPMHRDERAQLLARTAKNGFADDYAGIRISRTGKRFRIEQAIIWNVLDERGTPAGQAATFSHWTPLPDAAR